MRGLPGVADGEADVVHTDDRKRIRPSVSYDATDQGVDITTFRRPERCGHPSMLTRTLPLFAIFYGQPGTDR